MLMDYINRLERKGLDASLYRKMLKKYQKSPDSNTKPINADKKKPVNNTETNTDTTNNESNTIPNSDAESFSWVDTQKVSPIKYQGMCGSCWTFSSAAVFESSILIKYSEMTDTSEQNILDCAASLNGRDAGSCNGGWYGYVFDYYSKNNIVSEVQNPYKVKESFCKKTKSIPYKVTAWGYVSPDAGLPSVSEIKKALVMYGPLAACVKVTEPFQAYVGGIFDEFASVAGPSDINHAIVIVGWDDRKKAFLIKNSWSEDWGEKGYMWIEYNCNNIGYGASWAIVEKVN